METPALLEVRLKSPDDFLKIKETLTRMGVAARNSQTLYQSCHILHKKGRYYVVHFKEMFLLDGRHSTLSEEDVARRNTIALLLEQWGLLSVVERISATSTPGALRMIKIISYAEKQDWRLVPKYIIGKKHV